MILSRHAQVENLTGLLAVRRDESRQGALRHAGYVRLLGAILERPASELDLALPISRLGVHLASVPGQARAA